MPATSTTARRLCAYQVALDRLARPARPTTAPRRCAPTGDGTLHALLTASTYFTLAYIYVVIGSKDLLTSIEVPRTTFAVCFYLVYLTGVFGGVSTAAETQCHHAPAQWSVPAVLLRLGHYTPMEAPVLGRGGSAHLRCTRR